MSRSGPRWCVLCERENADGAFVGCGSGDGERFAHASCWETAKRIVLFVTETSPLVADKICSFIAGEEIVPVHPWLLDRSTRR
jgi:hypothetical protein